MVPPAPLPPPQRTWLTTAIEWLGSRRPVYVVRAYVGRYGSAATLALAVMVAVAVLALVLARVHPGWVVAGLGFAVLLGGWCRLLLGPRAGILAFAAGALVTVLVSLWVVMTIGWVVIALVVTVAAAWLTLGLLAEKTATRAALAVFAALTLWSGAIVFTRAAGARVPELDLATVQLKHGSEPGYLIGRGGDRVLLAQNTGGGGSRHVLELNDDDVERVDIGDAVVVEAGHEIGGKEKKLVTQPPSPGPKTTTTPTGGSGTTPPNHNGNGPTDGDGASAASRKVVASADGTLDGAKVQFQVLGLSRRGSMLILDARLANLDDPGSETDPVTIGAALDDGRKDRFGGTDDSLDGIRLLDATAQQVYGVARDSHHVCVCTNRLSTVTVAPGDHAALTATFEAPNARTDTMQILVPGFDRLRDVPVEK